MVQFKGVRSANVKPDDDPPALSRIYFALTKDLGYSTNCIVNGQEEKFITRLNKQTALNSLPRYSIWYYEGHGWVDEDEKFIGFPVFDSLGGVYKVTPVDISNNINGNKYKFVFLNGCRTMDPKSDKPREFQTAFGGGGDGPGSTVYYGWKVKTNSSDGTAYAVEFLKEMSHRDIYGNNMTVAKVKDKLINRQYKGTEIDEKTGKEVEYVFTGNDASYFGDPDCKLDLRP